jgi:hypothetical protein
MKALELNILNRLAPYEVELRGGGADRTSEIVLKTAINDEANDSKT